MAEHLLPAKGRGTAVPSMGFIASTSLMLIALSGTMSKRAEVHCRLAHHSLQRSASMPNELPVIRSSAVAAS